MVKFICDGCGKKAPARYNFQGTPLKPAAWIEIQNEAIMNHVCSNECGERIKIINHKSDGWAAIPLTMRR